MAIPAATAVITLVGGALLNGYNAHQLEEKKFELELHRQALRAGDDADRLRTLCRFVDAGLLRDPSRAYARAEIAGRRPCAAPSPEGYFAVRQLREALASVLGEALGGPPPRVSVEDGFLKSAGRLLPYTDLRDSLVIRQPASGVSVEYFDQPMPWLQAERVGAYPNARAAHAVVLRSGQVVQVRNLFDRAPG